MFIRWGKSLLVLALVLAISGHWAWLQSAAWASMLVKFSSHDTLGVALQKTFDGRNPCALCKLVKSGQTSEQKRDLKKLQTKLDLLSAADSCTFFPPRISRLFAALRTRADLVLPAPPPPPPRAA